MGQRTGPDASAFKAMEKDGWERSAPAYEGAFGQITRQAIEPLLDAADVRPGVRALEVCCGIGDLAAAAAQRGATVLGLDFSPAMLAQARQRHPTLQVREGDAEALPGADASVDVVLCSFGVRHLPHPERLLAGAQRVLVPGGRLAFTDWFPAQDTRESFFRLVRDAVRAHGDPAVLPPIPPPPYNFTDGPTCQRLVEQAGFTDWGVTELPIVARWATPEQVLESIRTSMARTRSQLEAQPAAARQRIEQEILASARRFDRGAGVEIPMPAALVRARKP